MDLPGWFFTKDIIYPVQSQPVHCIPGNRVQQHFPDFVDEEAGHKYRHGNQQQREKVQVARKVQAPGVQVFNHVFAYQPVVVQQVNAQHAGRQPVDQGALQAETFEEEEKGNGRDQN